jgi:5-amino-6-(5-phosphoribosylamino)uracil reductase
LTKLGLKKLGVLGGGKLVASLVARDLIDELYLTICPLILGGEKAPTPVEGWGLSVAEALKLELVGINAVDSEVFLHYRRSL